MTSPERTTISLVGDHPFHVGSVVKVLLFDGTQEEPQPCRIAYADPNRIVVVKIARNSDESV